MLVVSDYAAINIILFKNVYQCNTTQKVVSITNSSPSTVSDFFWIFMLLTHHDSLICTITIFVANLSMTRIQYITFYLYGFHLLDLDLSFFNENNFKKMIENENGFQFVLYYFYSHSLFYSSVITS